MFENLREHASTMSVLFLVLSLLSPWFVMVTTQSSEHHEDLDKDKDTMIDKSTMKESYYLDKSVVSLKSEEGKKTTFGVDAEDEDYDASYTFYEDSLEGSSGTTNSIIGYMHSIYKIVLLILVIRVGLLFGESALDSNKTLLFTSLIMFIILTLFLFGFKNAYISTYDRTILENDTPNEPDVNMTFIAGFGNNSIANYQVDYNEIIETYRYERFGIVLPEADWIDSGSYFYFNSGSNINEYYVWFDKNGDGSSDKPYVTNRVEIRVDISEFTNSQNSSREALRDETFLALNSKITNDLTLQKDGNEGILFTATQYGETENIQNQDVSSLDWYVQENGGIDQTVNSIYSSLETKVRWHPSWGFAFFLVSACLNLIYRNED
tara:strand:- start:167 stop:1303 length:1137 start_codon:yes stop_codon:yes gene_type:complete